MVLLENDEVPYTPNKSGRLLPLKKKSDIVVVGEMAERPVYQGDGSSRIVPTEVDIPLEELKKYSNVTYLRNAAFPLSKDERKVIKKADAVVVFAGTPDGFDTEGTDRTSLHLPPEQYALVDEIVGTNVNTVTVVSAGAPVVPPKSTALLFTYLAGQGMGGAVAAILFGHKNPSGRLAETFPMRIEDTPCFGNFPGDGETVRYGEGTLVGYRWYNKARIEPRYEFGYGLSYTEFEYGDWDFSAGRDALGTPSAAVRVANVGEFDGKEVVQLYIDGELRGFKKVFVPKGESVTVEVEITPKAGRHMKSAEVPKVTLFTQVKALWNIPNGRDLFDEICGLFGEEPTEELVNTRDCSKFVGNMLRNMVTMFDLGWDYPALQQRIDKVNKANGL
jgi:beta-glucosidase